MNTLRILLLMTVGMLVAAASQAQIIPYQRDTIPSEWVIHDIDSTPSFGIYKDNYFIFGTSVGPKANKHNTDVKFQISVRQRLTRSTLPWGTYLYLCYTQRVFWNVCEKSVPMHDFLFNPGIGLFKPFYTGGRFIGGAGLLIEHESNGRDGEASRSWNKVTLFGNMIVFDRLIVNGKIWIPIVDGEYNHDLLRYAGLFQVGASYHTPNNKFGFSAQFVKRMGWDLNFNTTLEFSWHVFKRNNLYLFAQYYNGFGENLLDYNRFGSRLRVGFVIKPRYYSEY